MQTALRILVILMLIGIVASLGSALYHLSRRQGDSGKMLHALMLRVGLSVALFALLMLAWSVGLIAPHGL